MIISNNLSDNNHLTHLKLQKVKMPHKLKVDNHYTVIGFSLLPNLQRDTT